MKKKRNLFESKEEIGYPRKIRHVLFPSILVNGKDRNFISWPYLIFSLELFSSDVSPSSSVNNEVFPPTDTNDAWLAEGTMLDCING